MLFIIVGLATGSAYAATRAGLVRPRKTFGAPSQPRQEPFDGPGRSSQPERGPARIPGVNLSPDEKGELAERRGPSEPEFSWIQ